MYIYILKLIYIYVVATPSCKWRLCCRGNNPWSYGRESVCKGKSCGCKYLGLWLCLPWLPLKDSSFSKEEYKESKGLQTQPLLSKTPTFFFFEIFSPAKHHNTTQHKPKFKENKYSWSMISIVLCKNWITKLRKWGSDDLDNQFSW